MAGHSHWAQIKRAKGANDSKRGQLFSRIAREITMATKLGGGDPDMNPRLRTAIATGRAQSMPNDTIERAIKKGTGEIEGATLEELTYEGYAPGGVALLIQTSTDNKNRTAQEVRAVFTKRGGNMGTPGSVSWMFKQRGVIQLPVAKTTEDDVLAAALDAGADDVRTSGDFIEVFTTPDKLFAIEAVLRKAELPVEQSKIAFIPENLVPVSDEKTAQQIMLLVEALDELEDVQNVFANFDIPDEVLAKIA